MFVKQVKRKCSVRGCKSTDSFAISRTREVGNTVIICKSCLGKALGAIDEIDPKTKSNIPVNSNADIPPLFFNASALGSKNETTAEPEEDSKKAEEPDLEQDFICPDCGKAFDNEKGLKTHSRHCKKQNDKESGEK